MSHIPMAPNPYGSQSPFPMAPAPLRDGAGGEGGGRGVEDEGLKLSLGSRGEDVLVFLPSFLAIQLFLIGNQLN